MEVKYTMDFRGFTSSLDVSVGERMRRSVRMLCAEAKRLCPERTGALKKSLTWEVAPGGRKGWYGSNRPWRGEPSLEYAIYQEIGFRHWRSGKFIPGKAYLRTPLNTKRPELQKIWGGFKLGARGVFEV